MSYKFSISQEKKMKHTHTLGSLLLLVMLSLFFPINAQADNYPTKVGEKLGNGVANVVTGVAEIPKTMMITGHEKGAAYGMTAGFFIGIVHMLGRTLSGAVDIATFVVPTTPIVNPAYIWDDFDKETSYTPMRMRD
jgi:putative exosortase-associated protein (TIGR04073 family)